MHGKWIKLLVVFHFIVCESFSLLLTLLSFGASFATFASLSCTPAPWELEGRRSLNPISPSRVPSSIPYDCVSNCTAHTFIELNYDLTLFIQTIYFIAKCLGFNVVLFALIRLHSFHTTLFCVSICYGIANYSIISFSSCFSMQFLLLLCSQTCFVSISRFCGT